MPEIDYEKAVERAATAIWDAGSGENLTYAWCEAEARRVLSPLLSEEDV